MTLDSDFRNGYHGASPWCMGITSIGSWKHGITLGTACHHVSKSYTLVFR